MRSKLRNIWGPSFVTVIYLIFLYFFMSYIYSSGIRSMTEDSPSINVGQKIVSDIIACLGIVVVIIVMQLIQKKPLRDVGITRKSPIIVTGLSIVFIVLFLLKGDFTLGGFYTAFFYLVLVAFSEEFVFRGYLFTAVEKEFGFWIAAIISGTLWGIPHAFIPSILNNSNVLIAMLNQIGGGIVMGAGFAFLYKKSGTLFVPVLIHAILDYL